jgi:hypothetical protein
MVENSVGRIYLDNNPHATAMKERWKYLVDPDTPTPEESKYRYNELTNSALLTLLVARDIFSTSVSTFFTTYILPKDILAAKPLKIFSATT